MLPEHTEELTMEAEKRLWLDKEEGLFPGPNYCGQQHQKQPVGLAIDRSFDLSMEDYELLS
jgi:hypothetical protein